MSAILVGSSGFGGSARILADCAGVLASLMPRVIYIGMEYPHHLAGAPEGVQVRLIPDFSAGVLSPGGPINSQDVLFPSRLAEEIVSCAQDEWRFTRSTVLLWGHYLFPYGEALRIAVEELRRRRVDVRLWLTPAGSDIWEIGAKLPATLASSTRHSGVSRVLTYSARFASEVEEACVLGAGGCDTFTPCVSESFAARGVSAYRNARRGLGFDPRSFVLGVHGNMRPVKNMAAVLKVAETVAIARPPGMTVLALAGPPDSLPQPNGSGLIVRRFGILSGPELANFVSGIDVEINLSRHDSFNMSVAEAMMCGVLPVTSDVAGVADHVANCRFGLVAREPFLEVVPWLLDVGILSPEERLSRGSRVAEYAANEFSRAQLENRLSSLLRLDGLER